MSKICGYSCEHNKSGVCQITGCSKKSYMSDKTETELFRETWYDIHQIRQLQQENKQLKQKLDCDLQWAFKYEKQVDNWNKLKEYIRETKFKEFEKSYGKRYGKTFTQAEIIICNMIIDKMEELQGSDSNVKN